LILTTKEDAIMLQYLEIIRWKLVPQKNEFANCFFLTHTGNEFCKINETIQHIGEEYDIKIPSARLHRKVQAYSAATSAMYYQLPSQNDAVNVHTTIQEIKQIRYFTTEEDSYILQEYDTK